MNLRNFPFFSFFFVITLSIFTSISLSAQSPSDFSGLLLWSWSPAKKTIWSKFYPFHHLVFFLSSLSSLLFPSGVHPSAISFHNQTNSICLCLCLNMLFLFHSKSPSASLALEGIKVISSSVSFLLPLTLSLPNGFS